MASSKGHSSDDLREPLLIRADNNDRPSNSSDGKTLVFDLEGLTCAVCVHTSESALKGVQDVKNVRIGLFPKPFLKAEIKPGCSQAQAVDAIVDAVESVGFGCTYRTLENHQNAAKSTFKRTAVYILGGKHMDLERLAGSGATVIEESHVPATGETKLDIEYDTRLIRGKRDLLELFSQGFGQVRIEVEDTASKMKDEMERSQHAELIQWRDRTLFALLFAVPALIIAMGPGMSSMGDMESEDMAEEGLSKVVAGLNLTVLELVMAVLTTPVMFVSGWPFHREAFKSLRTRRLGMSFLVSLGATSAYVFSWGVLLRNAHLRSRHEHPMQVHDNFETCALLIAFVVLGKYLESVARFRTSEAITGLAGLRPATAVLIDPISNKEREIPWDLIQSGDLLRCALGARIPADGVVEEGRGLVDQSALTGESMPVQKSKGELLMSGSLLKGGGGLSMRVTGAGEDSALSGIIKLVENAQLSKAPVERLADEISKRFVPLVVVLSLLTWLTWTLIVHFGEIKHHQHGVPDKILPFIFALSVLVVACPCALGLATPTAVMVGSGVGAANGVLIKSGSALEALASVTCFVFDKTGTLTKGELSVEHVLLTSPKASQYSVLHLAALAERHSDHPIAKAICRHHDDIFRDEAGTVLEQATEMEEFEGKGVRCKVNQTHVTVGSLAMFDAVPADISAQVKELESKGCTSILVHATDKSSPGGFLGAIGLRDESKEDASVAVAALRAMGCEVFMITGDNFNTAHVIASEVGIDPQNVLANVLPSEKAAAIRALQDTSIISSGPKKSFAERRRRVAMVGDGVNDAPALAASDCGLAIGAGTQIAIESADMVLINSRVADVVVALDLSRVVLRRIRLNYAWAVVYNVLGVVFASGLLYPITHTVLPPWVAAGAMAFSSVSVVTSSLLLRRYVRPRLEPEFGTRRSSMVVRVDSIRVETFDGSVVEHEIDQGCGMLKGEACSCDPAKCTCVLCKQHASKQ